MQKTLLTMFVICALWVGMPAAQGNATVQLRDGSKVEGRIEELTADGTLFVRVSQHDQRRIPISSVALIDRVGGASGLPDTEVREAAGSQHLLLLSNGGSVKGQLVAIRGGQGSAQEGEARTYVFRAQDGSQQQYQMGQVSRVYLGTYPFAAITGGQNPPASAGLETGADMPGAIRAGCRQACAFAVAKRSRSTPRVKSSCQRIPPIARARRVWHAPLPVRRCRPLPPVA
jgi:hypothetical protein